MPYPNQILPANGNKIIDCNINDYYLIRHTDVADPHEIIDPVTGLIKPSYICSPVERMDDLSSSLLGIFEASFITLEFTEIGKPKYMFYCDPDEVFEVPQEHVDFTKNENRNSWTLQIGLVNNVEFPYTIGDDTYTATCRVVHSPMAWNFWHFSLRWDTDNLGPLETLDEKRRKKVARRIGIATRALLCNFARLQIPPHTNLPTSCYRNPAPQQPGCAAILALIL